MGKIPKRWRRIALALTAALVLAVALAGCTKTITITAKYRGVFGWYFVCDGPRALPCSKYTTFRVTQQKYDEAQVGKTYAITWP